MTCSGNTLTRLIETWTDVTGTFEGQHKPFAVLASGYALLFAGVVSGLVAWR